MATDGRRRHLPCTDRRAAGETRRAAPDPPQGRSAQKPWVGSLGFPSDIRAKGILLTWQRGDVLDIAQKQKPVNGS